MTSPKVIGIVGKAGSGKDTLADMFVNTGFVKMAIADGVKTITQKVYGTDSRILWGPSPGRTLQVRTQLECIGQAMRDLDENYWSDLIVRRITSFFNSRPDVLSLYRDESSPGVVVSDVRYAKEAQRLIDKFGAILIKIDRVTHNTAHGDCVSEKAVDEIPAELIKYTVSNDGSMSDLYGAFRKVAGEIDES